MNVGFNPRVFLFERLFCLLDGVLLEGEESSQRQAAAATELHKKEADLFSRPPLYVILKVF